jgi:hypothetical protein
MFNLNLSVSTKRNIIGVVLGALSLANLPVVGPMVKGILDIKIIEPVTVGVVVGVVGLIGTYMLLAREGI